MSFPVVIWLITFDGIVAAWALNFRVPLTVYLHFSLPLRANSSVRINLNLAKLTLVKHPFKHRRLLEKCSSNTGSKFSLANIGIKAMHYRNALLRRKVVNFGFLWPVLSFFLFL